MHRINLHSKYNSSLVSRTRSGRFENLTSRPRKRALSSKSGYGERKSRRESRTASSHLELAAIRIGSCRFCVQYLSGVCITWPVIVRDYLLLISDAHFDRHASLPRAFGECQKKQKEERVVLYFQLYYDVHVSLADYCPRTARIILFISPLLLVLYIIHVSQCITHISLSVSVSRMCIIETHKPCV